MGNKQKKPIYKRVWIYVVAAVVIAAGIGGASSDKTEDRGEFENNRTIVITPEPKPIKDPFIEPTPEPLELLEQETEEQPVTRSAPVQEIQTEDTTQENAQVPSEEVRAKEPEPSQNTPNSNGEHVYVSASGGGERYHFDIDCTGGSVKEVTLEYAQTHGYTACKKCAGG